MSTTEQPLRLAVVDDHPIVRTGFAAIADQWPRGNVVVQAEDGVDYERQCAEVGHIHIALIDICMPRRDGYETLEWMARHQPRTKPMVLTLDPAPHVVKRALQAGALAVLPKTAGAQDVLRALDHVHIAGFHYNDIVSRELRRAVMDSPAPLPPGDLWNLLTKREREFLLLYTDPRVKNIDEVAERMGVGYATAETYRKNAAAKLKAHSKAEMVRLVLLNGWGRK